MHQQGRAERRAVKRHGDRVPQKDDQRPDEQVAWAELCAKARFVVNHQLSADDRNLLWWYYRDGLSDKEIAFPFRRRLPAVRSAPRRRRRP
jgi:hypothetical protein